MLDMIGTITATAIYTVLIVVLVTYSQARKESKVFAFAIASAWVTLMVVAAGSGFFKPGAIGPVPGPVFAFAILSILLFGSYFLFPSFRNALLAIPLPTLIAVNATRLAGVFFILLLMNGRLSAPFATSAGWGDILIGFLAIPLAISTARKNISNIVTQLWNVLGALDLVIAIALGFLSSPTPLRVFTAEPGTLAMTQIPWAMIPTMLVPIFLLIHTVIAVKIRSIRRTTESMFKIKNEKLRTT